MPSFRWLVIGMYILVVSTYPLVAQSVAPSHTALPQEGVFLIFPFENTSPNARLDWIGEGLEELTIQRLSAAGQQVYSHAGRLGEMDRSGISPCRET